MTVNGSKMDSSGSPVSVRANVQPLRPEVMFQRFGVEANAGVAIFVNVSDADSFQHRWTVTWSGSTYEVIAPPEVHSQGGNCDYAKVYCRAL